MNKLRPKTAMVLAAGLGLRLRPLTLDRPKPLIELAGTALIDRTLDHLAAADVETAVINLHHEPARLRAHVNGRTKPRVVFSDETNLLRETGGGVAHALPLLGDDPFFVVNGDVVWRDGVDSTLGRLARAWDEGAMDALLLLQATPSAIGYDGRGDYVIAPDGRIRRRGASETAPYVFAGIQILRPALFDGCGTAPFSLIRLYDQAEAAGRLFGLRHDGAWMHVGSPDGLAAAEAGLREP